MEIRKFGTVKEMPVASNSGIITPKKLDDAVVEILNNRISDEYTAHYFYRNAANWCRNMNYKKAAEYFENEANSELEHAKGIQEYMDDFNVMPTIKTGETVRNFEDLVDIINSAYNMELNLLEAYNGDSSNVFTSDLTTFDFLTEYRKIQKEAVIEYSDLLNALQLINIENKLDVLMFEDKYFG